jgi:hypothetical protein
MEAIDMTTSQWRDAKHLLSGCIYEQKWTDLTCDQLCNQVCPISTLIPIRARLTSWWIAQVSVACKQHGDLLRILRARYAEIFNSVSKVSRSLLITNAPNVDLMDAFSTQQYLDSLWKLDKAAAALISTKKGFELAQRQWADKHRGLERELQALKENMELQEAIQIEKRELIQQARCPLLIQSTT